MKNWQYLLFTLKSVNKFLRALTEMSQSNIEVLNEASLQIQSKAFYEEANLNLLVQLTKERKPRSLIFMKTVIGTIELLFQILEGNWKREGGIVVQKKINGNGSESDEEAELSAQRKQRQERLISVDRLESVF
jgi:hypothetical protein